MARGRDELLAELRTEVDDERVLAALAAVPREAFVAPGTLDRAWDNRALPIGDGQTISQPLVVARMCSLLELTPADVALEMGTGPRPTSPPGRGPAPGPPRRCPPSSAPASSATRSTHRPPPPPPGRGGR